MIFRFPAWKEGVCIFALTLCSILCTPLVSANGLYIADYIQQLEKSRSAEDFNAVFTDFTTNFKSGRVAAFSEKEVMRLLTIARSKSFAESLLPAVYGWALTVFGDGRMDEALTYFMESAEVYKTKNKRLAQAMSYFEIAMIHHKAKNLDEAKMYYERTLELGMDSLDVRTRINCYNGFALIHSYQNKFDSALAAFRRAYRFAETHGDNIWMGILAGNIGSIHKYQAAYDSSLYYYFRNLNFVRNTLEFENEIETFSNIANVYLLKSDYKNAKLYLDSACQIINNRHIKFTDLFNPMDFINKNYAEFYRATGDHQKALAYYERFHQVSEEKQKNVNGRSLKYLQSEYAFKQQAKEVEMLKKINEANILVIKQQRYIGIGFAIVILLLAAWIYNAYKTGKQRKSLNRELHQSNSELARLNGIKDKMFSVISHDLRSPIATLKSILTFVRDGHITEEETKELYSRLNHQLQACGNVLENLLQWAKAELSNSKSAAEKVILADVANEVALQLKDDIQEKNIIFQNNLSFQHIALADKMQVEIILRNLMANAVKFTSEGGQVKVAGKVNDGRIEIYVEDNGLGMHEEEVKNLFQPERSFTTRGTNQETGSGIGLLITKEMISKNGGHIWVSSRKDEGTVFTFTLPIAS
jgi:two-component system, sensor histidine kinase and response regulator